MSSLKGLPPAPYETIPSPLRSRQVYFVAADVLTVPEYTVIDEYSKAAGA